ncbi:MAG: hypothetical protein GEV08_02690 [Acidimicrobiia bacterium]|nr:hypothetical protein [Acidimicrobiia bacterium]
MATCSHGDHERAGPGGRKAGTRGAKPERVRLRIGNLAKAVLVSRQAYQDPKDALNEFVSNAADEYAEGDHRGERIRVLLRRRGVRPVIVVDDDGRGMSPDRRREVTRNLFESAKAGDDRTLGEKAIGILAFQQLGGRCDVVSRADGSTETWALRLSRGQADAQLERERRRARATPGTTVYLSDLDPDVLRVLTQRKVVDYLRARRSAALARGDYGIEVVEGRSVELVTPERPDGIRLEVPARSTLWGKIEFALYVAPPDGKRRRVAVVGRAGTSIIEHLCELDEFSGPPWDSDQVSGQIAFPALHQTAGRRAVLRDRDAFPVFVDALRAVTPAVARAVERVAREIDERTSERLADAVRRVFGRVLKELTELDNPMRSQLWDLDPSGSGDATRGGGGEGEEPLGGGRDGTEREGPGLDELLPPPSDPVSAPPPSAAEASDGKGDAGRRQRTSALPSLAVDPEPGSARSRFDPDRGMVLYNDRHADYLLVKDDEAAVLDYLATLVAKEYVVYNNPRAQPDELAEEMVRLLVRVRRHLPRRPSR